MLRSKSKGEKIYSELFFSAQPIKFSQGLLDMKKGVFCEPSGESYRISSVKLEKKGVIFSGKNKRNSAELSLVLEGKELRCKFNPC